MNTFRKCEMKKGLFKKVLAVSVSFIWTVLFACFFIMAIMDFNISEAFITGILTLFGLVFIKVSIQYARFSLECIPYINNEYRYKDIARMLENEEFKPFEYSGAMDENGKIDISTSQNWICISGYLFPKSLVAAIDVNEKSVIYIDGGNTTFKTKEMKKALKNLTPGIVDRLGIKKYTDYVCSPEYEDIEDMFSRVYDKTFNNKLFAELTREGMTFEDIRKKWDENMK